MPYTPIIKERSYDENSKIGKTTTTIQKYDEETGEVQVVTTEKVVAYGRNAFAQVDLDVIDELATKLTINGFRTFFILLSVMTRSNNVAYITQAEVAKKLNVSRRTSIRGFVELMELNLIRKKCDGQWMLNPKFFLRSASDRLAALIDSYNHLPDPKEIQNQELETEDG